MHFIYKVDSRYMHFIKQNKQKILHILLLYIKYVHIYSTKNYLTVPIYKSCMYVVFITYGGGYLPVHVYDIHTFKDH